MLAENALAISITFLSFSAPITASIIARSRNGNGKAPVDLNGKYVQTREYDAFKADLRDRLRTIEKTQDDMFCFIKSRL